MNRRHGFSGTSTYYCWQHLKRSQGGVCARWQVFESFLKDIGLKPSPAYWLFRTCPYQRSRPGNVEWRIYKRQFQNIWKYLTPEEVLNCHKHIEIICLRGGYDFDAGLNELHLQSLEGIKNPVVRLHSWIKRYLPRILAGIKKQRGETRYDDEVKYDKH